MKQVTALAPSSDLLAYYATAASDVYFQRAQRTLAGAHVDAVVAMDFFAGKPGVLCGVTEAVRLLSEVLQEGDEAYAIAEGAAIGAKETALRVRAPYSRFGVYETALLGMLSSCTGWATARAAARPATKCCSTRSPDRCGRATCRRCSTSGRSATAGKATRTQLNPRAGAGFPQPPLLRGVGGAPAGRLVS